MYGAIPADWSSTRNTALLFFFVFFLCLSVALLNGFPLYTSDSDDYAGSLSHIEASRSPVPGLVAAPLYALVGAWALPIITSAMIAYLFAEFCDVVLGSNPNPLILFFLFLAACVPIFASFIMPDAWVFAQITGLIVLLHRWKIVVFVLVAAATAGHGANIPIMLLLLPITSIIWPSPGRAIMIIAACVCASVLLLVTANLIVDNRPFPETYAWSITASKMMNDLPETVNDLCDQEPGHAICSKRALMDANRLHLDDHYVWFSDLSWPQSGGLTRAEFTDLGKKLFLIALEKHPFQLAAATASDWLRAYDPERCFSVGHIEKKDSNRNIHFLIDQDHGWLARLGLLSSPGFCKSVYFINMILLGAALALSVVFFPNLEKRGRATLLILWSTLLANDLVFSLLSGMWTRYTLRAYGIFVLIVLVSLMTRRGRENIPPHHATHVQ